MIAAPELDDADKAVLIALLKQAIFKRPVPPVDEARNPIGKCLTATKRG